MLGPNMGPCTASLLEMTPESRGMGCGGAESSPLGVAPRTGTGGHTVPSHLTLALSQVRISLGLERQLLSARF